MILCTYVAQAKGQLMGELLLPLVQKFPLYLEQVGVPFKLLAVTVVLLFYSMLSCSSPRHKSTVNKKK